MEGCSTGCVPCLGGAQKLVADGTWAVLAQPVQRVLQSHGVLCVCVWVFVRQLF